MTEVVLDASALAEYLIATPTGRTVADVLSDENGGRPGLHVPHLCVVETISAFRGWVRRGELESERAEGALADLRDFPAQRWDVEPFVARIWELRDNVTSYDAAYVALAESLDATLVTCDARLARGVRNKSACTVTLVEA